jgi:hypothetical protein
MVGGKGGSNGDEVGTKGGGVGAFGAAGIVGMGTPAAAAALDMASWASVASGTMGGFSSPHFSHTQTVRPSLVVTAWQLTQETVLGSNIITAFQNILFYSNVSLTLRSRRLTIKGWTTRGVFLYQGCHLQ